MPRFAIACLFIATGATLGAVEDPPAQIDTTGFVAVTQEALAHREQRLVDVPRFLELLAQPGTVLLDTRSAAAFERKHIAGAVSLPFADFTADKLARLIPDPTTTILIYCNNNIIGGPPAFETKALPLALNIPTYIHLFGYGYREVFELDRAVALTDQRIRFAGSDIDD